MAPTQEFEIVNKVLGWGDHGSPERRSIWFVGIEEADCIKEEYVKKLGANPLEFQPADRDFSKLGRKGTQIREVMARILCSVSQEYCQIEGEKAWKCYKAEKLWAPKSRTCQINLYPLGKPKQNKWVKECKYEELFGFGEQDWKIYKACVAKTRFKKIKEAWDKYNPQATICFGTTEWENHRTIFKLQQSSPDKYFNGDIEVYQPERVILTPFFAYGHVSDEKADSIAKVLNGWKVSIP